MLNRNEEVFNGPAMDIPEREEIERRRLPDEKEKEAELRRNKIRALQKAIKAKYKEGRLGIIFDGAEILGVDPEKLSQEDLALVDELAKMRRKKIKPEQYYEMIDGQQHAGEDSCQFRAWLRNKISKELNIRGLEIARSEIAGEKIISKPEKLTDGDISVYKTMKSAQAGRALLPAFWRRLQGLKLSIKPEEETRQQFFNWLGLKFLELSEKEEKGKE